MRKNILGMLVMIGLSLGVLAEVFFMNLTVAVLAILLTPVIFVWTLCELIINFISKIRWKKIAARFKKNISNRN